MKNKFYMISFILVILMFSFTNAIFYNEISSVDFEDNEDWQNVDQTNEQCIIGELDEIKYLGGAPTCTIRNYMNDTLLNINTFEGFQLNFGIYDDDNNIPSTPSRIAINFRDSDNNSIGYVQTYFATGVNRATISCSKNVTYTKHIYYEPEIYQEFTMTYNFSSNILSLIGSGEIQELDLTNTDCNINISDGDYVQDIFMSVERYEPAFDYYALFGLGISSNYSYYSNKPYCPLSNCLYYEDYEYEDAESFNSNIINQNNYNGDVDSLIFYNNEFLDIPNASIGGVKYLDASLFYEDKEDNIHNRLEVVFNINDEDTPFYYDDSIGSGKTYSIALGCENNNFMSIINYDFLRYEDSFGNNTLIKVWELDSNGDINELQNYMVLNDNKVTFTYDIYKNGDSDNVYNEYYDISFKEAYGFNFQSNNLLTSYDFNYYGEVNNKLFTQSCENIESIWIIRKDTNTDSNFVSIDKIGLNVIETISTTTLSTYDEQKEVSNIVEDYINNSGFKTKASKYILVLIIFIIVTIGVIKFFNNTTLGQSSGLMLTIILPVLYIILTLICWSLKLLSNIDLGVILFIIAIVGTFAIGKHFVGSNNG